MINIYKDKRALVIKDAFFAIIALGLVITAVGVIVSGWNGTYNSGLTYDLDEFNQISSVSAEAQSQQEGIVVKSTNTGETFEGTSIRGVFGILNNIYQPFRVVFGDNGMLDKVTERFGIPDYLRQALVAAIVIAFTFTLVAILFRLSRDTA